MITFNVSLFVQLLYNVWVYYIVNKRDIKVDFIRIATDRVFRARVVTVRGSTDVKAGKT